MCVCVCACVHWVGHLGRMDEGRTPKQLLFGELLRRQPFYGVKKWQEICMQLALGLGSFGYARIVNSS